MSQFLWTQKQDFGPGARSYAAMAFDLGQARVVMLGGLASGLPMNDTWEWDGQNWTQFADIGPSARSEHAMAYDGARKRVVMFGGLGSWSVLPIALLLFVGIGWRVPISQSPAPLRGAWKLVFASLTTNDVTTSNASPQPGLVLFTERHYSLMYVEGSAPRVQFADPLRPTEAEKVVAYDTFVGHSGSYSLSDSLVKMQPVISKSPNLMGNALGAGFATFAYSLVGDTLRLTRRGRAGDFTMKLVRAE